jgi:hypothetical protein
MRESKRLAIYEVRLLTLVGLLADDGYVADAEGLSRLARGVEDMSTAGFIGKPYFGFCPSLSGRTVKARIHGLYRYGYVRYEEVDGLGDYGIFLTEKGERNVLPECLKGKKGKEGPKHFARLPGKHGKR